VSGPTAGLTVLVYEAVRAYGLEVGAVVGLALAVGKTGWDVSHVRVETRAGVDGCVVVRVVGHATFLRLPGLLDDLDALDVMHAVEVRGGPDAPVALPRGPVVRLEWGGLRHVDHACAAALEGWAAAQGHEVVGVRGQWGVVRVGVGVAEVLATRRSTS
jgi:hypothetical protein